MKILFFLVVLLAAVTLSAAYSHRKGRYNFIKKWRHHNSHHDDSHHDDSHHDDSHHDDSHHDYSHYDNSNHDDSHHKSSHHDDSHHDASHRKGHFMKKMRHYNSHHDDSHHDDSHHHNSHHMSSHHDDSHHDDSHHDDSHHDDSHHDDSHHKSSHHDDSHHDDSHHDDSHHDDSHHDDSHHDDDHHDDDHHVYRFAISENYGPYEYMDDGGYAHGFNIDLLQAVCDHAHKECYFVMDKHTRCWETVNGHEYPGIGLLGGFYDGCVGLFPTPERMNAFNFSVSYTTNFKAGIFYHKGSGLMGDDVHNLKGHKIGFMDGWAVNQHCLERQKDFIGNHPGEYEAIMFDTHKNMHKALMADEIDAAMTVDAFNSDDLGVAHAEPLFECTTGGLALMARYGDHVVDWWNHAFEEMVASGEYKQLCEAAKDTHGRRGDVHCL